MCAENDMSAVHDIDCSKPKTRFCKLENVLVCPADVIITQVLLASWIDITIGYN